MKKLSILLVALFIFYIPGKSQNHQLPDQILQYYKNKNYLSLYSLKSEREYLNTLYLKGATIGSVKSARLKQIAYLLFTTWNNYYHMVSFNGEKSSIPYELILPTIYSVDHWTQEGNTITVLVKAYTINENLIHELISDWNDTCSPDMRIDDQLKDKLTYRYKEYQSWTYENGRWETGTNLVKLIN